jgi:hypothetical protein
MNKHTQTLIDYNAWRRSEEIDMPHPKDIGEALDYAVDKLTGDDWIKCSDELPKDSNPVSDEVVCMVCDKKALDKEIAQENAVKLTDAFERLVNARIQRGSFETKNAKDNLTEILVELLK